MNTNIPKRKILILSTAYHPFVGGAEVAIKEITNQLGDEFDFDLITARLDKATKIFERIGNVNVYRVGSGKVLFDKVLLPFYGAKLAWSLNNKQEYSCIWGVMVTFSTGAGYIFNIFRKITGKKRIPIILTLQEGDSESYLKFKWAGLVALSWKLALWNTDMLTGISTFLIDRAKRIGFAGKNFLVPNGVDIKLFSRDIDEKIKLEIRTKLGKKEKDIFLVTSGRLTHKNATDDVISALSYLPANVHFIVIGKGDEGVKLQKQVNQLGLSSRVKFVGFLPYSEIPNYLSVCDIFIRPSRSEGFGNSFIEAMAAGIPVIATPVGGIPDFIDDKVTGVFCSTDNPKSIASAATELINNVSLRAIIVKNAKARVAERYDWKDVSMQMKSVFNEVF